MDGAAKAESEKPAEIEIYPSKLGGASDFSLNLGSHERKTEEMKPEKEVCISGDENKESKKTVLVQEDVTSCVEGDVDPEDLSPPTKS